MEFSYALPRIFLPLLFTRIVSSKGFMKLNKTLEPSKIQQVPVLNSLAANPNQMLSDCGVQGKAEYRHMIMTETVSSPEDVPLLGSSCDSPEPREFP